MHVHLRARTSLITRRSPEGRSQGVNTFPTVCSPYHSVSSPGNLSCGSLFLVPLCNLSQWVKKKPIITSTSAVMFGVSVTFVFPAVVVEPVNSDKVSPLFPVLWIMQVHQSRYTYMLPVRMTYSTPRQKSFVLGDAIHFSKRYEHSHIFFSFKKMD